MRRLLSRRLTALGMAVLPALSRAAHAEGMPQLDTKSPLLLAQVVWLVIIFAILYVLLDKWALPQVGAVLEHRAATIAADLEAARAAKGQADAAVAELTTATREAQARAQAEVNNAVAAARAQQAEQAASLAAQLDTQLAEAEQRIAAAREGAMGALRDVAGDTANALVVRLTGRAPAQASLERAVGDVIAARAA